MKRILFILAVATPLVSSDSAIAENNYMQGGHPFLGVGLGLGEILAENFNRPGHRIGPLNVTTSTTTGGFAWAVNGGYLWYQDQFAYGAELSYNAYPKNTYGIRGTFLNSTGSFNSTYTASSIDLLAVGKYFFTPHFNMSLKAGLAYAMQYLNTTMALTINALPLNTSFDKSMSTNTVMPAMGAGLSYQLTRNFAISADYKYVFGSDKFDYDKYLENDGQTSLKSSLNSVLVNFTYSL